MKDWFNSLAPRERLLVSAAGIVVLAGLFFLLVWQPLQHASANMQQRVNNERADVSWLAGLADEARQLRNSNRGTPTKGRDQSLLSLVDKTSRSAGLGDAVSRIQPEDNDQATITLKAAGFNKLLFWLHDLETQYGVSTSAFTVSRGDKPGEVQARVTLQRNAA